MLLTKKLNLKTQCNLSSWVCLPLKRIVFSELTAWCLDNLSGIHYQRQMIRPSTQVVGKKKHLIHLIPQTTVLY